MRSTAVVLWLMILLVFVPIAGAHALALLWEGRERGQLAAAPTATLAR